MQGSIVVESTIAATSTTANVLSGSQFATVSSPTICSLGMTAAATGILASMQVGGRVIVEPSPPPVSSVMPLIPDNFFYTFGALTAETLVLRVQNTTAAGIVFRAVVQLADG
jgi:hypothetical protein